VNFPFHFSFLQKKTLNYADLTSFFLALAFPALGFVSQRVLRLLFYADRKENTFRVLQTYRCFFSIVRPGFVALYLYRGAHTAELAT